MQNLPFSLNTLPKLEYASASMGFCLMASWLKYADLKYDYTTFTKLINYDK